jgi:hypothetical protein
MHVHEPGKHGRGVKLLNGDSFVIPGDWLKISLNPLETTANLTRYGLNWYAQKIFIEGMPNNSDGLISVLDRIRDGSDNILRNSEMLKGLDIDDPEHVNEITEILQTSQNSTEWWAILSGKFQNIVRDAIAENDIEKAVWAMAWAERCRSMLVFKEHLEAVVWMGHSARRLINVLRTWSGNKENSDEEFWQLTFSENSYVLSLSFSVPVVFIQGKAYVGGMNIDQKGARLVDFLYSGELSDEAILIEIKTPITKLLGRKYRNVYGPSVEISAAVTQVLDYRTELLKGIDDKAKRMSKGITAINPKCVLIAGNGETELIDDQRRRSFELFRANLKDVEVVTYDELMRKVEVLAKLFNIIHEKDREK